MHSIMPHMHLIGRQIKVTMKPPDGEKQTLLTIDHWDYNWQETYFLKEPMKVKAGTVLEVEAIYDNSDGNPNNPNIPPRLVTVRRTNDQRDVLRLPGGHVGRPRPVAVHTFSAAAAQAPRRGRAAVARRPFGSRRRWRTGVSALPLRRL